MEAKGSRAAVVTRASRLFDVTAAKDWANCEVKADVRVDEEALLAAVPVSYLLSCRSSRGPTTPADPLREHVLDLLRTDRGYGSRTSFYADYRARRPDRRALGSTSATERSRSFRNDRSGRPLRLRR
ncbi:DUF7873 family protein [Nocardia anaemiae]|uniref:DUF7873 family protein n=1 Tax=Nocardia anaemiae TaxID=263910 RepID=UPI0009FF6CFD